MADFKIGSSFTLMHLAISSLEASFGVLLGCSVN